MAAEMIDPFATEEERAAAALREAFALRPNDIMQAGFSFSWWRRGGEPGPDWLSDKLDVICQAGQSTGVYIRARNAPQPPFQTSATEFSGPVPDTLVRTMLHSLFESHLFERVVPSEQRSNLMDAMKQSFDLQTPTLHLQKTLYEPDASETGSFIRDSGAVAAYLRDHGMRRIPR